VHIWAYAGLADSLDRQLTRPTQARWLAIGLPVTAERSRVGLSAPRHPYRPRAPPRPSICGSLRSAGLIDAKSIDLRRLMERNVSPVAGSGNVAPRSGLRVSESS
jgi:hypothetical protein